MGMSPHLHRARSGRRGPERWHSDNCLPRLEYDAKNDALLAKNDALLQLVRAESAAMRADFATFRGEMRSDLGNLRGEIGSLRGEMGERLGHLDGQVQGLKGQVEGMKTSIVAIHWVLGLTVAIGLLQTIPVLRSLLPSLRLQAEPVPVSASVSTGPRPVARPESLPPAEFVHDDARELEAAERARRAGVFAALTALRR